MSIFWVPGFRGFGFSGLGFNLGLGFRGLRVRAYDCSIHAVP